MATLIALDFETAEYKQESACALGMARIEDMRIVDSFYSLIKPPTSKFVFTHIHGITWEDVEYEQNFSDVWKSAQDFIKDADAFIAHNASFDRGVLQKCCIAGRLPLPTQPFYCSLKASRRFLKLPSHSLSTVAQYFDIELKHHEALSDARASGEIFIKLHDLGYNVWDCLC